MRNLTNTATLGNIKVDYSWARKEVYKIEMKPGDDIQPNDIITSRPGSKTPVGRVESVNQEQKHFLVIMDFAVQKIAIDRKYERVS